MWRYATANQVISEISKHYREMRAGNMSVDEYAERAARIVNEQLVPKKR